MKTFLLFAPAFCEWPLALIPHIQARVPDFSFCGLTTGGTDVHRKVTRQAVAADARIDDLVKLEARWLETEVTREVRREVLTVFSNADLSKILISDRHVGWRYVSGAIMPVSPLMEACTSRTSIERYIFNLCKWVIDFHADTDFSAAFCYAVAGAPAASIAYFCRNKNIPFATISASRVENLFLSGNYPVGRSSALFRAFRNFSAEDGLPVENAARARAYLDDYRKRPRPPGYARSSRQRFERSVSFMQIARGVAMGLYGGLRTWISGRDGYLRRASGMRRILHNLTVGLRARRDWKRWRYHDLQDVTSGDFIYFPLHVNPEASTMVWAPMFTDQVAVIEALSKAMPLGMTLIVKEHLPMLGRRPAGFYEKIVHLPNVALLSPLEDGFRLISEAQLVCAITGTAAWEALLLGTPAVLIGDAPFDIMTDGLFKCTDFSLLSRTIEKALASQGPSDDELVTYLAAVYAEGFEFDYWNIKPSDLAAEKREAITNLVCEKLLEALSAQAKAETRSVQT